MGVINEELRLADQFSQTFRNFDAAANASINVAEEFQKALNSFSEGFLDGLINSLQNSRDELGRMAGEADNVKDAYKGVEDIIKKTTGNIEDNVNEQERFTREIEKSEVSARSLMGTVSKIAGAVGVAKLTESFIETSDQLSQITAKLNLINDGTQTTAAFQNAIYESAQRARGSYLDTANLVARIGMNAAEAFSSNSEIIQFAENLNKSFVIAGASAQEQSSVILQLSQALGSGMLRGQEFNAVMAGAPNIMRNVADYMEIGVGELRDMAAQGQITAEVVKKAMLGATAQINKQFDSIPRTFDSIMTTTENRLIEGMGDVFDEWSSQLESSDMQAAIDGATDGLLNLARVGGTVLTDIAKGVATINENWEQIEPILAGATTALIAYKILNIDIAAAVQGAWAAVNKELALVSIAVGALAGISTSMGNSGEENPFEYYNTQGREDVYRTSTGMPFGLGANEQVLSVSTLDALDFAKRWGNDTLASVLQSTFGIDLVNDRWLDDVGYSYNEYRKQINNEVLRWQQKSDWYEQYYSTNRFPYELEEQKRIAEKSAWYEQYYTPKTEQKDPLELLEQMWWQEQQANRIEQQEITKNHEEFLKNATLNARVTNEVKLSDEDLKVFRDIAENRYIANVDVQTLAPVINNNIEGGANLSADDIADAVAGVLIEQRNAHTSTSHG